VSFGHYDWTTGCLRPMSPAPCVNTKPNTSHGLALPYRVQPSVEPQPVSLALTKIRTGRSFREVWNPTASPLAGQRFVIERACLTRTPSACRFSQPPGAPLPPRDCWPCFMPDPLMGFALQSIAPPAQPYAVPDASDPHDVCNAKPSSASLRGSRADRSRAPGTQTPIVRRRG